MTRRNHGEGAFLLLWCSECYFHPEAVSRTEALWLAWEHLGPDPTTGMRRDHADHHMRVLLDPQGPSHNCDMKEHRDPQDLEPKKAPEGWFPDLAFTAESVPKRQPILSAMLA